MLGSSRETLDNSSVSVIKSKFRLILLLFSWFITFDIFGTIVSDVYDSTSLIFFVTDLEIL